MYPGAGYNFNGIDPNMMAYGGNPGQFGFPGQFAGPGGNAMGANGEDFGGIGQ